MDPNWEHHILTIHLEPPKRGQPLYKGQDVSSLGVLYMEVQYMYIPIPIIVVESHTTIVSFNFAGPNFYVFNKISWAEMFAILIFP